MQHNDSSFFIEEPIAEQTPQNDVSPPVFFNGLNARVVGCILCGKHVVVHAIVIAWKTMWAIPSCVILQTVITFLNRIAFNHEELAIKIKENAGRKRRQCSIAVSLCKAHSLIGTTRRRVVCIVHLVVGIQCISGTRSTCNIRSTRGSNCTREPGCKVYPRVLEVLHAGAWTAGAWTAGVCIVGTRHPND